MTVGASCQFQFRQPVPGSTTARLDLVSGHRLPTSVDAVLLMAETLVLSPTPQSHVQVHDLRESIILFKHCGGLGVRHPGEMRVNGQKRRADAVAAQRDGQRRGHQLRDRTGVSS
ncbi:MAG: hypothetical protein U0797_05615 [Gemmataceae bacterium]